MCERCGVVFIANAPNTKYCDLCKPIAKSEKDAMRKAEARNRPPAPKKDSFGEHLKALSKSGMTYAEEQRAKTLAMIPRIEI